jgi:hypothetical protein
MTDFLLPTSAPALLALAEEAARTGGTLRRLATVGGRVVEIAVHATDLRLKALTLAWHDQLRADPSAPMPPEVAARPVRRSSEESPHELRGYAAAMRKRHISVYPLKATASLPVTYRDGGQSVQLDLPYETVCLVTPEFFEAEAEAHERRLQALGLPIPKPPEAPMKLGGRKGKT